MSHVQRFTVVSTNPPASSNQHATPIALSASDGTALVVPKKMPAQADSAAATVADIVIAHNALLAKLRTAGLLT